MTPEPTEWKIWGMYAVSKDGYMKLASYIPYGKPVGTYLMPRLIGSKYPRYRLTKKGSLLTYRISELLKKVWGIKKTITLEEAEVMRQNAMEWNDEQQAARIAANQVRRSRLPKARKKIQFDPDEFQDTSDPFLDPSHPQSDPFSNWR